VAATAAGKAVGSLNLHDGRLNGLLSIPKDSLTPILQMLIASRFQFVEHGWSEAASPPGARDFIQS
jgi:hypothetical protein